MSTLPSSDQRDVRLAAVLLSTGAILIHIHLVQYVLHIYAVSTEHKPCHYKEDECALWAVSVSPCPILAVRGPASGLFLPWPSLRGAIMLIRDSYGKIYAPMGFIGLLCRLVPISVWAK